MIDAGKIYMIIVNFPFEQYHSSQADH